MICDIDTAEIITIVKDQVVQEISNNFWGYSNCKTVAHLIKNETFFEDFMIMELRLIKKGVITQLIAKQALHLWFLGSHKKLSKSEEKAPRNVAT